MPSRLWMSLYTRCLYSKAYNLQVIWDEREWDNWRESVTSSCKLQFDLWFGGKAVYIAAWQTSSVPAPPIHSGFPHAGVFFDTRRRNTEWRRNEMPRGKLWVFLPLCETTEKPSVHGALHQDMDSELKNFSSEEGPSQHTSGCKPMKAATHTHTQCQYS